jgi:hypothetical protein
MSEHKWEGSTYPKTCQALEAWGVDPRTVCVDDVSESGYYKFVFEIVDGKKKRMYSPSTHEALKVFTPWPEGSGNTIYKIFMKEL